MQYRYLSPRCSELLGLRFSQVGAGIGKPCFPVRGQRYEYSSLSPGNAGLLALADVFSEDSSSSLCQLDIRYARDWETRDGGERDIIETKAWLLPGYLIHLIPTSSNCIKPDGLLEFAKRLERWGRGAFGHLRLFQNWLDQDAVTAREAIRRLRATCHVVSDSWDSTQAFADYVSTM